MLNKQEQKKEIITLLNDCDLNLKLFDDSIKSRNIELSNFKNQDFDVLIYSIEKGQTPEIVKYIVREGEYTSVNYTLTIQNNSSFIYDNEIKVPLFEAIACENFKVADLLINLGANIHYAYNENKNIGDYLYETKCINKRTITYLNLKDCLRYINNETVLLQWLINNNYDELKILFEYTVNDNTFILSFLNLYKNRTSLTNFQLQNLILSQKKKINLSNKIYKKAIFISDFGSFNPVQLFYLFDGSSKELIYHKTKKNNILYHAMINKNKEVVWRILYYEFLNSESQCFEEVLNCKESEYLANLGREAIKLFIDQVFRHPNVFVKNNHSFENIALATSKYNVEEIMIYILEKLLQGSLKETNSTTNLNISLIEQLDSQYLTLILNMAIKINNIELVKYLIENTKLKSIKVNIQDRNYEYPLFVALENTTRYNNNINIFEYILSCGPHINIKDEFGQSLLSVALLNKKYKAANLLLKYKESIELDMQENYSPLIKAIYQNQISDVKSILSSDKLNEDMVEQPSKKRRIQYIDCPFTPITLAYLLNRKDIFTYMLTHSNKDDKKENNSYIRKVDIYGYYLIYYSILKEDIATFKLLLDYYKCTDCKQNHLRKRHSILEIIFAIGNKDIFFALEQKCDELECDVFDMYINNDYNESPLISLLRVDDSSLVDNSFKLACFKYYTDEADEIEEFDRDNKTLLFYAMECKNNPIEFMKVIIDSNPDSLNYSPNDQYPPIYHAITINSLPLIKYLMEQGASIDVHNFMADALLYTPFIYALKVANIEVIKYLLTCSLNLNFDNQNTQLTIFKALNIRKVDKRRGEILELLLEKKLKADTITSRIIKELIMTNNKEFLSILFDHGFNINHVYNNGGNLLFFSIILGNITMVKFLKEKGIDFGLILLNDNPMKYLDYIIKHNQISSLKYLIEQSHMDVNIRDHEQDNLLNIAIKHRKINIIKYLIDCGTRTDNVNRDGKSLYDTNEFYNYQYRFYYDKINKLLDKANSKK